MKGRKTMFGSIWNKILRVNLTTGEISVQSFDESVWREYIGGSGMCARIVYNETDENTDPLSPDNVLVVMNGAMAGTKIPCAGRFHAAAKSPLTGIYGEGNCGGNFSIKFKRTGFDGIVVTGASDKPVYVNIEDDKAEILDASGLWGKDCFDTDEYLKQKHGQTAENLYIGPAGENLVKIAALMNAGKEGRAIGRCGLGAVMGSKGLKAISVNGTKEVPVAEPEKLRESSVSWSKKIRDNTKSFLGDFGTTCGVAGVEEKGDLPIKNWSLGSFDVSKITGQHMANTVLKKSYFCDQCAIGCGRVVEIKEGKYQCEEMGGPEYETMALFGPNMMIDEIPPIQQSNLLCNKLGLDTISAAGVIAFGMEAFENNLFTKEQIGDVKIRWGEPEDVHNLIEMIAEKRGVGALLGGGVRSAAQTLGSFAPDFAVEIKGLEFPAHDPRAADTTGLQYATSTRGACHLNAYTSDFALPGFTNGHGFMEATEYDRFAADDKAVELVYIHQNVMAQFDSMSMCKFSLFGLNEKLTEQFLDWFKTAVGWEITVDEWLETGERIFNLKRMYLNKCGISRKDDTLPPRMNKRRGSGSAAENIPDVAGMLDRYYEKRGWNTYGIPTDETLKRLNLAW
jgi:aldehyde:ferredoxin oxidoreductase